MGQQVIIEDFLAPGLIGLTGLAGKRSTIFTIDYDHRRFESP
jgi:hypothetical protein